MDITIVLYVLYNPTLRITHYGRAPQRLIPTDESLDTDSWMQYFVTIKEQNSLSGARRPYPCIISRLGSQIQDPSPNALVMNMPRFAKRLYPADPLCLDSANRNWL